MTNSNIHLGVVSDAPPVLEAIEMPEHVQNQTSFHEQVAKRFRLVPNFFVSAPDAPEIIERLWAFAAAAYLDNPIPTLFKERLLFSSRVSVRSATALCVTADFLLVMGSQRATQRLGCKPLSR